MRCSPCFRYKWRRKRRADRREEEVLLEPVGEQQVFVSLWDPFHRTGGVKTQHAAGPVAEASGALEERRHAANISFISSTLKKHLIQGDAARRNLPGPSENARPGCKRRDVEDKSVKTRRRWRGALTSARTRWWLPKHLNHYWRSGHDGEPGAPPGGTAREHRSSQTSPDRRRTGERLQPVRCSL